MSAPENGSLRGSLSGVQKWRFGAFEVDRRNRELRNRGLRVRLQEKPFRILELLLERAGGLVTREELLQHLWPGLRVDFARNLNTAVNSLRDALGDSSRTGRFIETRSGLGYRFVAQVEEIRDAYSPGPAISPPVSSAKGGPYEDYLKGRYFCGKMSEADLYKGVAHFESAIAQDEQYAPAYAGLADAYHLFAFFGMLTPREAGYKAHELAATALQLNSSLPEAHSALGTAKTSFEWNLAAAEIAYLRALDLNPNYAEGHRRYAALLSKTGRANEAMERIRRAQELDPVSLGICAEAGWICCMAGRFEKAIEQCWKALDVEAQFVPAQYTLGLAYQQLGMTEEASVEFENARTCSGNSPVTAAALAHAYAASGRSDTARAILKELRDLSKERYISAYWMGLVWAGLNEHERALDALEQACEQQDVWLTWLAVEPRFASLSSHARFRSLLGKVGLKAAG